MLAELGTALLAGAGHNKSIFQTRFGHT